MRVDEIHRAPVRGRCRTLGRQCRGFLRQRVRRDGQGSLRGRGRGPWRSFEAVEFPTLDSVDWFTNRRLLEPIHNIPPAEAEERYYAMLEEPAVAA